jgi:hypothetical protein
MSLTHTPQPAIYVVGNIFFIKIGSNFGPDVKNKYMKASSEGIYSCDIWTEEEIREKHPTANSNKSLLEIKYCWTYK